ncbi:hypothetical protein NPA07_04860 [Mycoplasmopsis caviae]|uniref:ATP synthase gamma chain n=1 Tax=Mycoplasmopsis caviae TaxID=55603 RepID=A0A3P8KX25_9BACT|nr:hypothetical protein [Mycoplasmopsis caviae]UUD35106.1 hypothetical protein NPA07_04860 [Mycoplasmopsis caviae]VDR42077.1 Uncharacterised protein [Mycoplasmopsis caviae]
MHLDKLVKKIENLKNIDVKVNNDKNILLISMMKLNKHLSFYINNAVASKHLIDEVSTQFNIKNAFVKKNKNKIIEKLKIKKFFKPKELWIYLTEEQKYATDSYSRYEKYILSNHKNVKMDLISIGERALKFCTDNKLNVIKHFDKNKISNKDLSIELCQIIKVLYVEGAYEKVRFVINSNKNFKSSFILLPTQDFDVNKLAPSYEPELIDLSKFKILPSAEAFIDNEANIFIENAINSLIIESSFYTTKNALVTTNKIIKDLDEQILKLSKKVIQVKREKEIEEIVLLTRGKAVLDLDTKENDEKKLLNRN